MEYKIIHGKDEEEIEEEINKLVKEGYEVESFNTASYGGGFGRAVYLHVLMKRNRLE